MPTHGTTDCFNWSTGGFGRNSAGRVIDEINPILRGWVVYFSHGNATECFNYVRNWVEKTTRRHLERNSKRRSFGWNRWSTRWLYSRLGLFDEYRVTRAWLQQKALPVRCVT